MKKKKVFVSGCFDMLHSGHIAFFEEAATYGAVYVGLGSDKTIMELKNREPICKQDERLYMVTALKSVKDAFISSGSGYLDFLPEVKQLQPDIFFVNEDGSSQDKEALCKELGIEYVVRPRQPKDDLPWRSTTKFREMMGKK